MDMPYFMFILVGNQPKNQSNANNNLERRYASSHYKIYLR